MTATADRTTELSFVELEAVLTAREREGTELRVCVDVEDAMDSLHTLGVWGTLERVGRSNDAREEISSDDREAIEHGHGSLDYTLLNAHGHPIGDFRIDQLAFLTGATMNYSGGYSNGSERYCVYIALDRMRMSAEEPFTLPNHRIVLTIGWGSYYTGVQS